MSLKSGHSPNLDLKNDINDIDFPVWNISFPLNVFFGENHVFPRVSYSSLKRIVSHWYE